MSCCARNASASIEPLQVHECKIALNDVKPENFVCFGGKFKVIDLDSAAAAGTKTPIEVGSDNYYAPERMLAIAAKSAFPASLNADVFSLGLVRS